MSNKQALFMIPGTGFGPGPQAPALGVRKRGSSLPSMKKTRPMKSAVLTHLHILAVAQYFSPDFCCTDRKTVRCKIGR